MSLRVAWTWRAMSLASASTPPSTLTTKVLGLAVFFTAGAASVEVVKLPVPTRPERRMPSEAVEETLGLGVG